MPSAPLRYCLWAGCQTRVPSGYCREHSRQREHQRENWDVRRLYRTARWRRLRDAKRAENPLCVDCKAEGRIVAWEELDHQVPHRGNLILFWAWDNLVGRCSSHHSQKTARGA